MKPHALDSVPLEPRLSAYLVAVGATFAVAQPAEATIIYHEGPWTATGTNTTLVSFNLAGDVLTNGDHVSNEQFFIGHQEQPYTFDPSGGGGGKPGKGGSGKKGGKGPPPSPIQGTLADLSVAGQGDAAVFAVSNAGALGAGQFVAFPLGPTLYGYPLFVSQQGLLVQVPGYGTVPFPPTGGKGATGPTLPFVGQAVLAQSFQAGDQSPTPSPKVPPTVFPSAKPGKNGGTGEAPDGGTFSPFPIGSPGLLGLVFDAPGDQLFPGWAEIIINGIDSITVLGYAYEDTGAPIRFGDTGNGGPGPEPVPEPSTLALFALGATGLAALRRRRLIRSSDARGQDRA